MRKKVEVSYDKKYDILYLGFADRSNSYCFEETDNGIIFLKDDQLKLITGITIIDFKQRLNQRRIREILCKFRVDIKHDIMPYL
jgi:uncharacterized protein YuzE